MLISYPDTTDTLTFTGSYAWFPVNHTLAGEEPDPAGGSIEIESGEPGMATIDYGDGTLKRIPFRRMSDGTYKVILGSIRVGAQPKGTLMSGGALMPEEPHIYADGEKERVIKMMFTNKVSGISIDHVECHHLPIFDTPSLNAFRMDSAAVQDVVVDKSKLALTKGLEGFEIDKIEDLNGEPMEVSIPAGLSLSGRKGASIAKKGGGL